MSVNKCRACLIEKNCSDLYDWYLPVDDINEKLTYQECFHICTQLDVNKADATSSYVKNMHFLCHGCVQELICSFRFLRKAQNSAQELDHMSEKNEFEYINIQEWCKSEIFTDVPPKAEHTVSENTIKIGGELTTSSHGVIFKKWNHAENDNGLSEITSVPSDDRTHKTTQYCVRTRPDLTLKANLGLKMNPSDSEVVKLEMVGDALDIFEPISENILNDSRIDCKNDALKKEISNTKRNSNIKEGKKICLKRMKTKNLGGEFKQIPCEYCKKNFPENKLKQHKSRYHRPKIFLCDICPSSFSIANNLRRHQRIHDLDRERNFSCGDCGRKFFTEDVYRTHIKIHQSRQAKFKCTQCDKAFMHKGSLTLHLQKHTGPKNECGVCMKRYVRKVDLEVHMRNHSGDLPYQCSNCKKAFMTTSALRKHEILHNGIRYKCDICYKEYSHPSKLSRHRLDHTGLPLKCTMCDKGFAEPNKIRRHIKCVHKVEESLQINKLIMKMPKNV